MANKSRRQRQAESQAQPQPQFTRWLKPLVIVGGLAVAAVLLAGVVMVVGVGGGKATGSSTASVSGGATQAAVSTWHNVTPEQLADMLSHKDFTLVDVKTPYIGEIDGTDLYIPYDQLAARGSELPTDKSAKILVYCRSGVQSAQAAQTLLGLGYTNVWNLEGGMNAWTASGRTLVQKNR
jgi:phage shock protein E